MREEMIYVQSFGRSAKVLLRSFFKGDQTIIVVSPVENNREISSFLEDVASKAIQLYGIKPGKLMLVEHQFASAVMKNEKFEHIKFGRGGPQWEEISRNDLEEKLGVPYHTVFYGSMRSPEHFKHFLFAQRELVRFVNNVVSSLGQPILLGPDLNWIRDKRCGPFYPLEEFERNFRYGKVIVQKEKLVLTHELEREERTTMTEYLRLNSEQFATTMQGVSFEALVNSDDTCFVVNVDSLGKALSEKFVSSVLRVHARLLEPFSENEMDELSAMAVFCLYGWRYGTQPTLISPDSLFNTSHSLWKRGLADLETNAPCN